MINKARPKGGKNTRAIAMGGGLTLEPHRGSAPWAAVVRLTPAMLTCLEGMPPGRASMTLNPTGDATLRVGDNVFTFAIIPEDVPGDLIRGSLENGGGDESNSSSLRVAGTLRCRLQPKRSLTGTDGLAARVKRRVEEESGEMRSRKTMVTDFVPPTRDDDAKNKKNKEKQNGAVKKITRALPRPTSQHTTTTTTTTSVKVSNQQADNRLVHAAVPQRVSERLAQLASSAAKAASGRAANQTRAAILTALASRPLSSAAVFAAVSGGLASAGLLTPHRTVFELEVKKLAALKSPGKYYLLEFVKTEARELLAAAEKDVPDAVTTPPLCIPSLPTMFHMSRDGNGDKLELIGLTDDEREEPNGGRTGEISERASGDKTREDDPTRNWVDATERCTRVFDTGTSTNDKQLCLKNDKQFRNARALYQREYETYLAMHAALESNANEFANVVHPSERKAFMETRKKRYGAMAVTFDALEKELRVVKQAVVAYAEGKRTMRI